MNSITKVKTFTSVIESRGDAVELDQEVNEFLESIKQSQFLNTSPIVTMTSTSTMTCVHIVYKEPDFETRF